MLDLNGISLSNEEKNILLNPHVGGVILFARNIISRQQFAESMSQIPHPPKGRWGEGGMKITASI